MGDLQMESEYSIRSMKFMFSLITIFLMLPLLVAKDNYNDYFRTIFIYLASKDLDILATNASIPKFMFKCWDFLNQFVGCIFAALSCALLYDGFAKVFSQNFVWMIKIAIFLCVISMAMKEILELFALGIRTKNITQNINNTLKENKGVIEDER